MTYEELRELKNGTTILITYPSGRFDVILFYREQLSPRYYMLGSERISLDRIRLATKEDIDLYILNKQIKLDQLERELKAGL